MNVLSVISAIFALGLFWLLKKILQHGKSSLTSQGIPIEQPLPIIGNIITIFQGKESIFELIERFYKKFANNKFVGYFTILGNFNLIITDLKLIKQITIKDFDVFVNRDRHENVDIDKLLSKTILLLRDQKWKDMRSMISPIFTSSKMKYIYGLLTECSDEFIQIYEKKAIKNGGSVEIDTHDVFARVTADGISSTALGIKGDCITKEDSEMFEIAEALETDFTTSRFLQNLVATALPKVYKFLGWQMFRKSLHEFFETFVLSEIQKRRNNKITRPDVIQLLVQAKEGQLKHENGDIDDNSYTSTKIKKVSNFDDVDLVAQSLALFLGGFETTAFTLQSMAYELALNPEIQQTLIKEVDEMLQKLDGRTVSYDDLNEMKFLDMVLNETLRLRPAFRATTRLCSKNYQLKDETTGKAITIKKGTQIIVPIKSIQLDSKYFPNPENFDPYRFSDENKGNIESGSFIPFGIGPRICIGSRYALLESKLLLFALISKFSIEKTIRTPEKLTRKKGMTGYNEKIYVSLKLRN